MQALAETVRRLAEDGGGLCGREPIPGDEHERLAIALAEARERAHDAAISEVGLPGVVALDVPALGLDPQSLAPGGASTLGPGDVTRDGEQPWQRRLRYVVEPPPDDEERLGDDVIDRLGRHPAPSVGPDRGVVCAKQRLKAGAPGFRSWHTASLPAAAGA
jgi:hypothetical protein